MGERRKSFPLRIDSALWASVERLARSELRSVNAQVECLLREAMKERGIRLSDPSPVKRGRPPKGK